MKKPSIFLIIIKNIYIILAIIKFKEKLNKFHNNKYKILY